MADNLLYIPLLNPVKFFDVTRADIDKYFTKHFDDWMYPERLYDWQSPEDYCQIWQTDDIINLQFESTFDPIIVKLIDSNGVAAITLPALIGLPNIFYPNTWSFEVAMSLAGLPTGCYYLQITAGSGDNLKTLVSPCQYISDEPIRNSIIMEYWNSRFHGDVIFESGIQMQFRVHGNIGFLEPGRKDELYKDERYNPTILNSKTFRQWPVNFGDEFGLPDDIVDLLNRIWSCDNVLIDDKPFGITEGGKFEFTDIGNEYPKRGVRIVVEEGINRHSKIFSVDTDTNKKLTYGIMVDKKVFGDTSNQGSGNTVPVLTVE